MYWYPICVVKIKNNTKDTQKIYLSLSINRNGNKIKRNYTKSVINYLRIYGKISARTISTIPDRCATILRLDSTDFLLPYSLDPHQIVHQIPKPRPHFGFISNTDPLNINHAITNIVINRIDIWEKKTKQKYSE